MASTDTLAPAALPNAAVIKDIQCYIDNAGSVVPVQDIGYLTVDFACTILSVTLLADASGSVVCNIYKSSYANYPGSMSSIVASAKPTLSSAQKAQDTTLTGWTTSISAGDVLKFTVESASTITKLSIILKVQAT